MRVCTCQGKYKILIKTEKPFTCVLRNALGQVLIHSDAEFQQIRGELPFCPCLSGVFGVTPGPVKLDPRESDSWMPTLGKIYQFKIAGDTLTDSDFRGIGFKVLEHIRGNLFIIK